MSASLVNRGSPCRELAHDPPRAYAIPRSVRTPITSRITRRFSISGSIRGLLQRPKQLVAQRDLQPVFVNLLWGGRRVARQDSGRMKDLGRPVHLTHLPPFPVERHVTVNPRENPFGLGRRIGQLPHRSHPLTSESILPHSRRRRYS